MDGRTRVVVLGAVALLAARALGCSSSAPVSNPDAAAGTSGTTGVAGASGTTGVAGASGTTGDAGTGGATATSGTGGGGTGGVTSTGGTGGTGGIDSCSWPGTGGFRTFPCGPASVCDGDTVVSSAYCDQNSCQGSVATMRTACPAGSPCGAGRCLQRTMAPAKSCTKPTDCELPASICVGAGEQMVFSDPTCDEGQCHWKQIVNTCGGVPGLKCSGGQCYDAGMQTRGPITPMPMPVATQPPTPPAHACAKAADCPTPAAACYGNWSVTYVAPSCHASACAWEVNLTECAKTCDAGACAP